MGVANAEKMGYRQRVGNGKNVKFWEDQWFGSATIQFWDIYSIVNEEGKTINEAWDGVNLKFGFRRTVNRETMNQWEEIWQIASNIQFSDEEDDIIWQFNSSGVQSLYAVINDIGVTHIHSCNVEDQGPAQNPYFSLAPS